MSKIHQKPSFESNKQNLDDKGIMSLFWLHLRYEHFIKSFLKQDFPCLPCAAHLAVGYCGILKVDACNDNEGTMVLEMGWQTLLTDGAAV